MTKIKAAMHYLQVIKNVAADALDDDGAGGLDTFVNEVKRRLRGGFAIATGSEE